VLGFADGAGWELVGICCGTLRLHADIEAHANKANRTRRILESQADTAAHVPSRDYFSLWCIIVGLKKKALRECAAFLAD
jgi:hypothetical protein